MSAGRRAAGRGAAVGLLAVLAAACATGRPDPSTATPIPLDSVGPGATPAEASPATERPPDAWLAAEGGDPVEGQLGSYTWDGAGSDSPWLPGTPIEVGAGEPLTVNLAGGTRVASWTARLAPADVADGTGARPLGGGGDIIAFPGPEAGAWTIQVSVRFQDGGSATYAWRVAAG